MKHLWRITSPYFVAGIILDGCVVWRTAPILYFMRSWSNTRVEDHCRMKKWSIEYLS